MGNYGADIDRLDALGVKIRVAGGKKEATDRILSDDITTMMDEYSNCPKNVQRPAVVIMSSDKDFNRDKLRLKSAGFMTITVHSAQAGSEHCLMLKGASDRMIGIEELIGDTVLMSQVRQKIRVADSQTGAVNEYEACWLVDNVAKRRLLADPFSNEGCLCAAKTPHAPESCNYVHFKTQLQVDGVMTPIARLAINNAVFSILERPTLRGKMCTILHIHNVATCGYIHLSGDMPVSQGRTLCVDGQVQPITRYMQNAALETSWSNPSLSMRMCQNQQQYDPVRCTFLHYRTDSERDPTIPSMVCSMGTVPVLAISPSPLTITVDGTSVRMSDLVPNPALTYCINYPAASSAWCLNISPDHDAMTCKYIHVADTVEEIMVNGELVDKRKVVRDFRMRRTVIPNALSAGKAVGSDVRVNICGTMMQADHLVLNRGLSYLLNRTGEIGKMCINRIAHDPLSCNFIHRKENDVVNVEGTAVHVTALQMNMALKYLQQRPGLVGKWCPKNNEQSHLKIGCCYIHSIVPRPVHTTDTDAPTITWNFNTEPAF
jgi:hypothetical protein